MSEGVIIYILGVASGAAATLTLLWLLDRAYHLGKRDARK